MYRAFTGRGALEGGCGPLAGCRSVRSNCFYLLSTAFQPLCNRQHLPHNRFCNRQEALLRLLRTTLPLKRISGVRGIPSVPDSLFCQPRVRVQTDTLP